MLLLIRQMIITVLLSAVLLYSAYQYGMYFDTYLYPLEMIFCGGALMAAVMISGSRRGISWTCAIMAEGRWYIWWPFIIAAVYAIHLAASPVSMLGTLQQTIRWTFYGIFFLFIYAAASSKGGRAAVALSVQLAGAFIAWSSLAFWMGWASFPQALFYSVDEQISSLGARLAGFFQYPNMLAAVMAMYSVWYLVLLSKAASRSKHAILPAMLLVPTIVVLILTESRGAWLVAGAGWLAGLLLVKGVERKRWLLLSALSLPQAALLCQLMVSFRSGEGISGSTAADVMLIVVLFAFAMSLTISLHFVNVTKRLLQRPLPLWLLLAGGLAGTGFLLPHSLSGRLESGQYETAGARWLFYKDAFRLFREAPWFGRGGETWRMLFERIQQQPYVGSKVHSSYLDFALDLGAAGLLALLMMFIIMLVKVWRHEAVYTLPALLLLAHAAVDFDNAFGFYWLLVFSYFSIYLSGGREEKALPNEPPQPGLEPERRRRGRIMALAVVLMLGLGSAAWSGWRLHAAWIEREKAVIGQGTLSVSGLVRALELNPYWTQTRLELTALLGAGNRITLLLEGLGYEPESAELLWQLGSSYAEKGKLDLALQYMEQALIRDRFNKERQTSTLASLTQLAHRLDMEGRVQESHRAAKEALAVYSKYEGLVQEVGAMQHPANGRRFELTAEASEYARSCQELLAQ
ncbi:tetratricopeptide repeat protein [Paenibacillus pinihumi]|uniref:tetratricopeptide repeat protein n=1 Tax=Paenibacillus pinihumi TaxID=669462 RepID=UPI00041306EE|nr:tetratricopeptide repeat protein [Paenibacillus pinihumi]